jgi:hypothetical protein
LTYQEVYDWIEDFHDFEAFDDYGELYEQISNDWVGRNDFSNVISLDEFLNHYEGN